MKLFRAFAAALIAATLLAGHPSAGFAGGEQDEMYRGLKKGQLIPYGQIARSIEARYQGRIVGQRIRQTGPDQWIYNLKVLRQNGEVLMVVVDAQTGHVIRTSGKRR